MTGQPETSRQETFRIDGSDLMDRAKQLVDEGNKHRLVVRNEHGKNVFDIPLTVAVVGGIIVLPATAVGAIAALATRHSIVVESVGVAATEPGATGSNGEPSEETTTGTESPDGGAPDSSWTSGSLPN
jgi:hypothetical protein